MKIKAIVTLVIAALMFASNVQAEMLGLPNGRSANPVELSDLSVELGFVTADLDAVEGPGSVDYQNIGARVNYRVSPEIVVIGDIGTSEYGNYDGTPVGLGIMYFLSRQRISPALDISAKASFHWGEYKNNGDSLDLSSLTVETLFSSKLPLAANGLKWYGNIGYHLLTLKSEGSDKSNEIGIGGGLTLPVGSGEAYFGFDLIDEMLFGIGYRYFVK